MDGSKGDANRRYISTGTEAAGVPLFQNKSSASPPNIAKIGSPRIVTANRINSAGVITFGVPEGITYPKMAGMASPSAARARPFQPGLACQMARRAIIAKPAGMMARATHFG